MKTLYRQGKLSALQSLCDLGVLKKKGGTLKIEKNLRIGDWKCIYKRSIHERMEGITAWKKRT